MTKTEIIGKLYERGWDLVLEKPAGLVICNMVSLDPRVDHETAIVCWFAFGYDHTKKPTWHMISYEWYSEGDRFIPRRFDDNDEETLHLAIEFMKLKTEECLSSQKIQAT